MKVIWYFGPIVLIIIVMVFMSKRMTGGAGGTGGIFNVGKSKATVFDKNNGTNVTFKDVSGSCRSQGGD